MLFSYGIAIRQNDAQQMPRKTPVRPREIEVCNRLRQAREGLRISRVQFAKALGIDSTILGTYERAKSMVRFETGVLVCKYARVTPWWLAEGAEPRHWPVFIPPKLRESIPQRILFSEAYDLHLKPHLEEQRRQAERMTAGLDEPGKEEIRDVFPIGIPEYDLDTFVGVIAPLLPRMLKDLPPHFLIEWWKLIESATREFVAEKKQGLTGSAPQSTMSEVKSPLADLLNRLNRLTSGRGLRAKLARDLGVEKTRISEWLSGKKEPGGENALRLLYWVRKQEESTKEKSPGSATNTTRAKTRSKASKHENIRPGPRKA